MTRLSEIRETRSSLPGNSSMLLGDASEQSTTDPCQPGPKPSDTARHFDLEQLFICLSPVNHQQLEHYELFGERRFEVGRRFGPLAFAEALHAVPARTAQVLADALAGGRVAVESWKVGC